MPHSHLTKDPVAVLAEEVGRSAGIDITCTRDCEVLSDELRSFDGRYPISVSTLRRFFGLIPKKGSFSLNTLNTLARYIGYPSFQAWQSGLLDKVNSSMDTAIPRSMRANPRAASGVTQLDPDDPSNWSTEEAKERVRRFLYRFEDPKHFHLTTQEFARLKAAVFRFYERGSFDMELWLELVQRQHLLKFVVEQFPPLDFLATFGKDMMASYLRVAETPADQMFGNGLVAAGKFAVGEPWKKVVPFLSAPEALNPSIHPLVQARNLGLRLVYGAEHKDSDSRHDDVRNLVLDGLRRDVEIWPRWGNQNCYFAFNIADWAVLSGDREIVEATYQNIESFRTRQDWYQRDPAIDTLLTVRQVWNGLILGETSMAARLAKQLEWGKFLSMETRTLGLWYHAAMGVLEIAPHEVCKANMQHCASITHYHGLHQRIEGVIQSLKV